MEVLHRQGGQGDLPRKSLGVLAKPQGVKAI